MMMLGFQQISNYFIFQKLSAVWKVWKKNISYNEDVLKLHVVFSLSEPYPEEIKERNNTKASKKETAKS